MLQQQKEILLLLYGNRNSDIYLDISSHFKTLDREVLFSEVLGLENEGYVVVDWPKYAFGFVDYESDEDIFTPPLSDALSAKLSEEGILFVENYLLEEARRSVHKSAFTSMMLRENILVRFGKGLYKLLFSRSG